MKKLLYLAALILTCHSITAQTVITSGTVYGDWTAAGSPYIIKTNLWVPPNQCLRILAGVDVQFDSLYQMDVQGTLVVQGTADHRVVLHSRDTTGWYNDSTGHGGWRGIRWHTAGTDSSRLVYCDIRDAKTGFNVPMAPGTYYGFLTERALMISNLRFSHNQGLLIHINGPDSVHIDNSEFFGNIPVVGGGVSNGVILSDRSLPQLITMRNCKVHDNAGTALRFYTNWLVMEDNEFYNCEQAIESGDLTSLYFRRNKVHHNTSYRTATVNLQGLALEIDNNFFYNNKMTAPTGVCGYTDGGGGLRLVSMAGSGQFKVRNNVFANNETSFVGGGMSLQAVSALIANNTFVNNKAVSGGQSINAFAGVSDITYRNNIFWSNTAAGAVIAGEVTMPDGGAARFNNNLMKVPMSVGLQFQLGLVLTGDTTHNVMATSPGLMAPTAGTGAAYNAGTADFSLAQSSMAVNRGDSTQAQYTAKDVANAARIYGSKIDIGAYELQKAGTNTGIGVVALAQPLQVSPNPAADVVTVQLLGASGRLYLVDIAGRIVWQAPVSTTSTVVPVTTLSTGSYQLLWDGGEVRGTGTVVVKH